MSKTELFYPTYDNFIAFAAGKKIFYTFFFSLFCWQGIWANKLDHRWDRNVLFSVFVIDLYSAHSQTKTIKIVDAFVSNLLLTGTLGP